MDVARRIIMIVDAEPIRVCVISPFIFYLKKVLKNLHPFNDIKLRLSTDKNHNYAIHRVAVFVLNLY